MNIDMSRYLPHLTAFDLSDEVKTELVQAVWIMMGRFVDRAFATDRPAQACGQPVQDTGAALTHAPESDLTTTYNNAAH